MGSEHERGDRKGQFCSIPAKPKCDDCPHPKDYIEVCEPSGWFEHTFKRLVNAESPFTFDKKYEAHHLVCVAPVTQTLVCNDDISAVIEQTKWCINNKDNMIAMPLWGHTVKWYCEVEESIEVDEVSDVIDDAKKAPKFKNIPQHDYDHNCKEGYTWEVEVEVEKLADKVKEQGHKLKGKALEGKLNKLSADFKSRLLDERGKRKGGTHAAWKLAQKEPPDPEWCHPFSMASDAKVSSKGFPVRVFDRQVAKWVNRIAKAISSGV